MGQYKQWPPHCVTLLTSPVQVLRYSQSDIRAVFHIFLKTRHTDSTVVIFWCKRRLLWTQKNCHWLMRVPLLPVVCLSVCFLSVNITCKQESSNFFYLYYDLVMWKSLETSRVLSWPWKIDQWYKNLVQPTRHGVWTSNLVVIYILFKVNGTLPQWYVCWLCVTAIKGRSLTGKLSLSSTWPTADGWPLMWVYHPL